MLILSSIKFLFSNKKLFPELRVRKFIKEICQCMGVQKYVTVQFGPAQV